MHATVQPTETTTTTAYTGGRPCARDWNALKPEIEHRIEQGDGVLKLSKRYGITPQGIRFMLRRLGLRTKHMKRS